MLFCDLNSTIGDYNNIFDIEDIINNINYKKNLLEDFISNFYVISLTDEKKIVDRYDIYLHKEKIQIYMYHINPLLSTSIEDNKIHK